uniref:ENT domain-containing protein n=1 Tax=Wuchereria bancrofti TaxID=6293 RepID=A0A1I8EWI0_WUCBA
MKLIKLVFKMKQLSFAYTYCSSVKICYSVQDRLGLRNAMLMDQQKFPMSSRVKTATKEQKKNEIVTVNEKLTKERVIVRNSTYDEEDCSYMLRVLEKNAFSTVVSAFRAQGMLNGYKRVLLEHLKTALFISDEFYHAEMRQAANDEMLTKIAQTLSPSYDTYAQWGIEGLDPMPHYGNIPIQEDIGNDNEDKNIANELLRLAKTHNERLRDANTALHEMITLPKIPYVPERLRLLLRETENDYEGRIDILHSGEYESSTRTRTSCVTSSLIKSETLPFDKTQQFAKITQNAEELYVANLNQKTTFCYDMTPSTSTARPSSFELTTSCPSSSSSSTPVITSADQGVLISKCGLQGEEDFDSQIAGEYLRPKKRRLRQRDLSATCARVLPFRFQSSARGQKSKPIRGNPDRRPPKQASPSDISSFTSISSLPINSSVIGTHSSHATALSTFCTIPTSSAASNSGRLHQIPHLFTSGVVIKRTRTLSSGGNESVILDGSSTFPRQLSNSQNLFRIQQPLQRAYIRSSSGQRFYASPIVSAYSNPTRPYYGNPNTVVGFMRSLSSGSLRSSYTISSGPSTSSTCHLQPQTITSSEIQRLVAQAAASSQPQQYRTIRRPPPRPVVLTSSSRFSVANQHQGFSTSVAPFINVAEMTGVNSCSVQQQQQLAVHPLRVTRRAVSSPCTVIAATQCAHTVPSRTLDNSTSLTANAQLQHIDSGNLEVQQSDLDTIAAVNSITQGNDGAMKQRRTADIDRSAVTVNPDEASSQVRLECDEMLLPESRYILPDHDNSASVQLAQLQQRGVSEEVPMIVSYSAENQDQNLNHATHVVPEQYAIGLIHQEGQNVINYVTASRCIQ